MRKTIYTHDREMEVEIKAKQKRDTRWLILSLVIWLSAILLMLCFWPRGASSQESAGCYLEARWDANTEPDLAGYLLAWRAIPTGPYDQGLIDLPLSSLADPANPTYAITQVFPAGEYWFVLYAYDTSNNRSNPSTPVYFQVTDGTIPPDTTPPADATGTLIIEHGCTTGWSIQVVE